MRATRRVLGILFFGVLMRDMARGGLLIVLGAALAQRPPDILQSVMAVASIVCASIFANIENDIADIELDRKVKAYRPLPSGRYTVPEARAASMAFLAASIAFGLLTYAFSRSFPLCILLLAVPLATHLYSMPPARLKARSWIGVMTLSLIYLSPLLLGYLLAGDGRLNLPLLCLLFLLFFLATGVKDFEDVEVDKSFGIMTPPVSYGETKTAACLKVLAILSGTCAVGLALAYFASGLLAQTIYCLAILPSVLVYLNRLAPYASSGRRDQLMKLVKGCLWFIYVWPTAAGIIIFLGQALLS